MADAGHILCATDMYTNDPSYKMLGRVRNHLVSAGHAVESFELDKHCGDFTAVSSYARGARGVVLVTSNLVQDRYGILYKTLRREGKPIVMVETIMIGGPLTPQTVQPDDRYIDAVRNREQLGDLLQQAFS